MNLINLNYNFLVFLYAYLRQIDLSLDRSRWGLWSNLMEYYKLQISPSDVIKQLLKISNLGLSSTSTVFLVQRPSLFKKLKESFFRLVIKKHYISDIEVLHCCQLLKQFNFLLNCEFSSYPLEAEKLRIEIAKFYSCILKTKINKKDFNDAMKVEHFMQNENLVILKIDHFTKGML